jgi:hypothetical protein
VLLCPRLSRRRLTQMGHRCMLSARPQATSWMRVWAPVGRLQGWMLPKVCAWLDRMQRRARQLHHHRWFHWLSPRLAQQSLRRCRSLPPFRWWRWHLLLKLQLGVGPVGNLPWSSVTNRPRTLTWSSAVGSALPTWCLTVLFFACTFPVMIRIPLAYATCACNGPPSACSRGD